MCKYSILFVLPVMAVAGLTTGTVRAEGLVFGGNIGAPHFESNINGVPGNGSGLSGKLYGGYQFTPNFSLETGIAYLGHVEGASSALNARGTFIDAVGIAPIDTAWDLLARIGLTHVDLNTSNGNGSGNGLKIGLGTQYAISKSAALRAEWEQYRPDVFGDKFKISQFTLGLRYGF